MKVFKNVVLFLMLWMLFFVGSNWEQFLEIGPILFLKPVYLFVFRWELCTLPFLTPLFVLHLRNKANAARIQQRIAEKIRATEEQLRRVQARKRSYAELIRSIRARRAQKVKRRGLPVFGNGIAV